MEQKPVKAHREPMVWLVFGLPALVVVAGIATLVIAIKHRDGGDVNEAVQRTGRIQQTDLGADERAKALGLQALLRERDGRVEVLPVAGHFPRGQSLRLLAEHPTDRERDRTLQLLPHGDGWLSKDSFETARGHAWKFTLTPGNESWRLRARMPKEQSAVVLSPALD